MALRRGCTDTLTTTLAYGRRRLAYHLVVERAERRFGRSPELPADRFADADDAGKKADNRQPDEEGTRQSRDHQPGEEHISHPAAHRQLGDAIIAVRRPEPGSRRWLHHGSIAMLEIRSGRRHYRLSAKQRFNWSGVLRG